jgi:lysophospholipase L1-like esterase
MNNIFLSLIFFLIIVPVCFGAETSTNTNVSDSSSFFTIVAFGDSTTAPRGKLMVYARILQDSLRSKTKSIRVINSGVGGNTTAMGRARFEKDVLAKSPDLVIIGFGINDSAVDVWKTPPETKPRVAQDEYENNLRYFVQTLKNKKSQVILMTPNALRWTPVLKQTYGKPPYNPDDPDGFNLYLRNYAESARKIARDAGIGLVDAYAAFSAYGIQPGCAIDDLLPDGMHPNDRGHRIVADLLIKAVIAANPDITLSPDLQ